MFREIIVDNCSLLQGQVKWDARDNSGNIVPQGVYVFQLAFKTCNSNQYLPACNIYESQYNLLNGISNVINTGDCILTGPFGLVCLATWNGACAHKVTVVY